jgi:hypothetical protein
MNILRSLLPAVYFSLCLQYTFCTILTLIVDFDEVACMVFCFLVVSNAVIYCVVCSSSIYCLISLISRKMNKDYNGITYHSVSKPRASQSRGHKDVEFLRHAFLFFFTFFLFLHMVIHFSGY